MLMGRVSRLQGDEIPQGVVRRGRLRHLVVRLGLHRVHEVRELDAIVDEEHRHVVADQVVVAGPGVELRRKSPHVADGVGTAPRAGDGGEPHEHRRGHRGVGEELRHGVLGQPTVIRLELSVGAGASGVHHPLRDPLVIEVSDLLAGVEVLQQGRTPLAHSQRVVGVVDPHALLGGERAAGRIHSHGI
jgi:hypothetical protein